jgi:rare lipoprotein A
MKKERKMKKLMAVKLSAMSLLLASCANSVKFSDSVEPVDDYKAKTEMVLQQTESDSIEGKASYYHDKFDGRMTANGEKFDQKALTAAHKTLPFGTVLQVTNMDNGKTVKVRINDRGPYVGDRVIDLSKAAAQQLGMMGNGLANVQIQIL